MIRFPELGLCFNISRVAIKVGEVEIYWYAILISMSILIFLLFFRKIAMKLKLNPEDILDLTIVLIPISLLGARIYYVIFRLEYYLQNPLEIVQLKNGGLAIYGGIIAGVITIIVFCKKRKIKVLEVTDLIAPFLALGQAIGRWGNFINGEAYGSSTNLPWRMELIENGKWISVHPTFFYESVADFILFLILYHFIKKRKYTGQITYWYLILYSFVRFFIEGLRTDTLMFFSVRISQILSLFIFVVFSYIIGKQDIKKKKTEITAKKT